MDPRGSDRGGETSVDIGAWLRSLGMQQYEEAFRDNAIDASVLPELTADDLKDLGVTLSGTGAGYSPRLPLFVATVVRCQALHPTKSPTSPTPSAGSSA